MNAAHLISEFAKVLNQYGPDSDQSEAFINQHRSNQEFVELAQISNALKRALMPSSQPEPQPDQPVIIAREQR